MGFQILVDADACPVVLEIEHVAKKYGVSLLIYTSVFSLILRFSQFFKTTRLPHAGILRHLVSEAAGRSDLRVQQTERRSLKFFEKAFCVPASPAVA